MGRKTLKELNSEIIKLRENHEKELYDLKNKHDTLKGAYDELQRKYDAGMKETIVNDVLKKCSECGESLNTIKELRTHMRKQHYAKGIECNKCSKMFDEEWKLNAHLKKHKGLSCTLCEKTFDFEDILQKHIKIAHEGTKLYCHFYNNEKNCPFEADCIFLHENSTKCRYGQLCERQNCMFKHRANEETVDDNDEENLDDDDQSEANVLCDNCEFLAHDELSLEVHYERKYSGYYDCALCAFRAENEENLNIHLFTCETFTCEHCDPKVMVKTLQI